MLHVESIYNSKVFSLLLGEYIKQQRGKDSITSQNSAW